MKNYALIFRILVVIIASYSFNWTENALCMGPPDYLPDGPHPRIWLTNQTLTALKTKRDSKSTDWQALLSWCDVHLNDAGYDQNNPTWNGNNSFAGYRMSGYRDYLLNFALSYQILKDSNPTKAAQYAAYVRNIMVDGIANGLSVGEEAGNGLRAIRNGEDSTDRTNNAAEASALGIPYGAYKLGYSSRNIMAVAVAYDWIHETLNQTDKDALSTMMFRWFDWVRGVRSVYNNGVLKNGIRYHEDQSGDCSGVNNCTLNTGASTQGYAYGNIANNFMGGYASLMTTISAATYGDHSYADTCYAYSRDTVIPIIIKEPLANDLKQSGGDSPEGWSYGSGSWFTLQGLYAHYTATGQDVFNGFSWPSDLLKANIHRLFPNYFNIPVWGDNGVRTGENLVYVTRTFLGVNANINPNAEETKVTQWLLDNMPYSGGTSVYEPLLWLHKAVTPQNPATSSLPLYYHAKGNGLVSMRSSWTSAPDTVLGLIRLEDKLSAAHENADEGGFYVIRGSDSLIDRETYTDDIRATSTIVFNDQGFHSNNPALTTHAINRIENGTDYTYVRGNIINSFKRSNYPNRANLFTRSFLFIRPNYFIIHDTTQSNPTLGNLKDWYTQYSAEPSINNNTITVAKGQSKAYIKTLYPIGGDYVKTNYTTYSQARWRVKYTPEVQQEYDQFLHVIEATASTASQTMVEKILTNEGKMIGSYIKDATKPTLALFNSNQKGGDITLSAGEIISYSIPASMSASLQHILVHLVPNSDVTILASTTSDDKVTFWLKAGAYPNEGTVKRVSGQGVLTFGAVSSGPTPPAPPRNVIKK